MATIVASDFGPIDIEAGEATGVSEGVAVLNPAIRGTMVDGGHPCIVLAMTAANLLVVDVDGRLHWTYVQEVQLDWRYNFAKEEWTDANGVALEDTEGA